MNIKESIINRLRETSRENIEIPLLDKDSLAISALLHDFCNCRCMRHIKGHGRRSAMMLKELGFHLSQEEFLAIRFHMSLKNKKSHPSMRMPSIAIFVTSFIRQTATQRRETLDHILNGINIIFTQKAQNSLNLHRLVMSD